MIKIMSKQNYWEKLRDPRWQRKRLEIMDRDSFTCVSCGDNDNTLNVHHKTYKKGSEPWEYNDENFITLCEDCHTSIHDGIDQIKMNTCNTLKCEVLTSISRFDNLYDLNACNTLGLILNNNLNYLTKEMSFARIKMAEDLIADMKEIVDEAKNKGWRDPFAELDKMIGAAKEGDAQKQ